MAREANWCSEPVDIGKLLVHGSFIAQVGSGTACALNQAHETLLGTLWHLPLAADGTASAAKARSTGRQADA